MCEFAIYQTLAFTDNTGDYIAIFDLQVNSKKS